MISSKKLIYLEVIDIVNIEKEKKIVVLTVLNSFLTLQILVFIFIKQFTFISYEEQKTLQES